MQILEILAQGKCNSAECHAHYNAQNFGDQIFNDKNFKYILYFSSYKTLRQACI